MTKSWKVADAPGRPVFDVDASTLSPTGLAAGSGAAGSSEFGA
jgi:hypothetical protein